MILLIHMLFGAAIVSYIKNPVLAVILAFFSHYLLDLIPHTEYNIENIKKKLWKKSLHGILKVILDFSAGLLLVLLFSGGQMIFFIAAFFAILPDGLTFLNYFLQNKILKLHKKFHQKKIHFLKNKKISKFWRIATQILIALTALFSLSFQKFL